MNLLRAKGGEIALCLFFVATGVFWIAVAAGLPLWDGFAPATGLLPLVFGALLVVLAVAATLVDVVASSETPDRAPAGRAIMVLLAVAAGAAGIETAGFFASMFVTMLFLFRVAEKRPLLSSVLASAGTALFLTLVFRTWLGVPLPAGPWGF
ncbi:MAG: tripartite tricarboxylate transporter TctB family protein [Telmatospirillum sp.]|nr:tripartite tricarboxylate transporter TctB family protein [Telmatospirillum sp.]